MFRLDSGNVLRAPVLEELPWLEHGFGTKISAGWPDTLELATVRQIHSDRILVADRTGVLGDGDALITDHPGVTLAIRSADCLPILMADRRNHAIAAVHAGWRGTILGIVAKTLQAMAEKFGTVADDVAIAIGPGIGACCFEVGPEVSVQFASLFPDRHVPAGRATIDLIETNRRQLRRNDGTVRHLATSDLCSRCRSDLLHSYRRDGDAAGRMVTTIRIR